MTATDAILSTLDRLRARAVALFAPYSKKIIDAETEFLGRNGVSVRTTVALDYEAEIRYISSDQLCKAVLERRGDLDGCDAVLFSCTALYTVEAFTRLRTEGGFETPLVSSNTAIADSINNLAEPPTEIGQQTLL